MTGNTFQEGQEQIRSSERTVCQHFSTTDKNVSVQVSKIAELLLVPKEWLKEIGAQRIQMTNW